MYLAHISTTVRLTYVAYSLRNNNYYSVILVHEQTIPTEQPPLVGEVSANSLQIEGVAWSVQRIPTAVLSVF
jgi:hypothetical protein